jgi:hypothetical protein
VVAAIGLIGVRGSVEDPGPDRRIKRPDHGAAMFGPGPGGDAQQSQPRSVTRLVSRREMAAVVHGHIDHPQRD